jgi:hypothetical protein
MGKSGFALSILAFCGLLFSCVFAHADQRTNWIAFNGTGGVFKYIMAVDEEGNILVPATAILSYDVPGNASNGEPVNPYKDKRGDTEDGGTSTTETFPPGPFGPLDGPCATALDQDGGLIKYYLLTAQGSVFRFDIPKATLVPTTPLPHIILGRTLETKTRDFRTLQSTQHISPPFLGMVSGNIGKDDSSGLDNIQGALQAFKFQSDGTLKSKGKNISPTTGKFGKIGSISADGHMALSNQEIGNGDFDDTQSCDPLDNDKAGNIYAQPLGSPTPVGTAQIIGNTKPQVGAVDVSNQVTPGVRFAVYATRSSDTPDSSNGDDLILQKIDSNTGAKIGGRHFLQENVEMDMTFFQGIAIDPEGEFVIFTKRPVNSTAPGTGTGGCGFRTSTADTLQLANRDSLYFLAIDITTGEAVGKPILLFSADSGFATGLQDENASPSQEFAIPQINGIDVMIEQD